MTAVSGIGYALLSLGPAFAIFFSVIVSKPFLVLTLLASTLFWLVSLVLIASLWRVFLPFGSSWLYLPVLLSAVLLQEIVRFLFWKIFQIVERLLDDLAVKLSKPRLYFTDKMEIALAIGLGHGMAHSVFFCLSILTPAFGPATFYVDSCSSMPFFLVTALMSLGFLLIHTFSMVIAFHSFAEGSKRRQFLAPGIHLISAFLTTINLLQGGCIAGVVLALSCAVVTMGTCGKMIWDQLGDRETPDLVGMNQTNSIIFEQ